MVLREREREQNWRNSCLKIAGVVRVELCEIGKMWARVSSEVLKVACVALNAKCLQFEAFIYLSALI